MAGTNATTTANKRPKPRRKMGCLLITSFVLMGVACIMSVTINVMHFYSLDPTHAGHDPHHAVRNRPEPQPQPQPPQNQPPKEKGHALGGLSCAAYGGPSDEIASEMVYWSDVESDSNFVSPFMTKHPDEPKYMTFEPDGGGWNNIRMAMETAVALSHAMGRILVMPPEQGMYLLGKNVNKQKNKFSFADFFHMDTLSKEHEGMDIISFEEFLKREAMTGHLVDINTGKVTFPPDNRTNWDGANDPTMRVLKGWIRNATHVPIWRPQHCIAAFPSSSKHSDLEALSSMKDELVEAGLRKNTELKKSNQVVPVDADPKTRMGDALNTRTELCLYDEKMQKAPVVHMMCYHKMKVRLLTHFYTFLYFEDWKQDLWTKRFVRDHLRYIDEIQCAAARVVHKIRERVRNNPNGEFDSLHIRRGDFQFKDTRVDADVLYENSKLELEEGATVYIATDERDKAFFEPFRKHYDILFLDDFKDEIKDINTNYYGMLDQLIASRGR
eukprot:scaffold478846_cov59-Attheya_sp.AAC.3